MQLKGEMKMSTHLGRIINKIFLRNQEPEFGGAVNGNSSLLLQTVLVIGQEYRDGIVTDIDRLAQVVNACLTIFSEDLDHSWLVIPSQNPLPGFENSMSLGDVLRSLSDNLPNVAPTESVYRDIHAAVAGLKFLRHWRYGWSRRSH
jgi:hypothetical protein